MKVRRFLAGLAAAAMIAGTMSMTAWAEQAQQPHEAYTYAAIEYEDALGNETYDFTKALTVESDANVPAVTFNFTVEKADAVAGTDTALPIYKTEVTPTIAPVTFTAGDSETSKTVSVSFEGVTFSEPGVYRYYITESADTPAYITNDPEADRTLDVYVQDNGNSTLEIAGVTFINGRNNTPPTKSNTKEDLSAQKSNGYTNTYVSHDLTIAKTVTGNQASKDKYFRFTVNITNAGAGTKLNVDTSNATTAAISSSTNGATTVSGTNPSGNNAITCGDDGTATVEVFLQHDESIKITGLPDGASYTITEYPEDYTVASVNATEDDTDGTANGAEFTDTITGDTTVTYTNDKQGVVPTGVMVSVAGPAAAGAAIVGGVILLSVKKRREDKE